MHLFYTPDISSEQYTLSEEESKHAIRVLRLAAGDKVVLVDGKGGFYTAVIADVNPKRTSLKILSQIREYGKRNHYLHIAVAPTKNIERMEWFLEKATEMGIDEITPVICDRSERKEVKIERLNKIITSAVKQSIKAYHPQLNEAISFKKLIDQPFEGQKMIAHCVESDKRSIKDLLQPKESSLVLIGPEGDFSPAEITAAQAAGFQPISLGEARLRTETAALAACFEINFLNR